MRRDLLAAGAVLAVAGACVTSSQEVKPVPSLASSAAAGAAFEVIREAWRAPDRIDTPVLRETIERFLARYPNDGLVPLARIYLALVAMKQGEIAVADKELALSANLPPGTARDLWTIASARRLRLRGQAEAALELLRPLVGKNVDPVTRSVFEEDLTLAALATHREYEAISYMDAWLRVSSEEDKEQTRRTVVALVERLPKEALVGALQAMRTERARLGYGVEIEGVLADRLVRIATRSGDVELARMLLDADAGSIVLTGKASERLGELAASRRGLNSVEGRTIGLLLPTESSALRDESADVLRGVMWALGLPRGIREAPAAHESVDAGPWTLPCAPPEPAPILDEPRQDDGVRLATRDDAGSVDRTEVSLDELVGEGAAIVIAGLDEETAQRALRWGVARSVPVISLVAPTGFAPAGFGFVLGEPRVNVLAALARAVPALANADVAPVIDTGEAAQFPAQGGRLGPCTLLPPVSCDTPSVRAGEPRFPVDVWERQQVRAWLVSGSVGCARDLVTELSGAHRQGVVALTLEAAGGVPHGPGLRVVTASTGVIPSSSATESRDDEVRRFDASLGGAPSWWTALGRDAATLARAAVKRLPTSLASESAAVLERRSQARDALSQVRARLWSTEASGWTGDHTMRRTLCAVDAAAR